MNTKTCNTCEETKGLDEFNADSSKKDGHRNQCKVCRSGGLKPDNPSKYRRRKHEIVNGEKPCTGCDETKPLSEFHKASNRIGYSYYCKTCVALKKKSDYKATRRFKKYGMTKEVFDQLMEMQKGLCAICDSDISEKSSIDHCHTTLEVRGLLCQPCNLGLGHFKDNVPALYRAIEYLK